MSDRHPATTHLLSQFEYEHLPPRLQVISKLLHEQAHHLTSLLQDGPELSTALRKLLEAKDCFVRQAVIDLKAAGTKTVNNPEPELRGD